MKKKKEKRKCTETSPSSPNARTHHTHTRARARIDRELIIKRLINVARQARNEWPTTIANCKRPTRKMTHAFAIADVKREQSSAPRGEWTRNVFGGATNQRPAGRPNLRHAAVKNRREPA